MYKHRYNYPKEYSGRKTANQSKNREKGDKKKKNKTKRRYQ